MSKHKTSLGKNSSVEFYGFNELIKKLDRSESKIKQAIESSMQRSAEYPKKDMIKFIKQHHYSGLTEESFDDLSLSWNGSVCKGNVGFNLNKGGIASIMLDVGTPKIKPTFFVYYATHNNMRKMHEEQKKALNEILGDLK